MREAVPLACVAGDAGADNVFPGGLTAAVAGEYMIEIQFRTIEDDAAVLAGIAIPLEDVVARELYFLLWQSFEEAEHDDARNPDAQRDCLQHQRLGVHRRKIPPTRKIMRHVAAGTIGGDNLRMPLIKERQSPPCGTGVDGLPQPVEDKDRLFEQ